MQKKIGTDVQLEINLDYYLIGKLQTNQIFCFTLWSINFSTNSSIFSQPIVKLKITMKKVPDS